MSKEWSRVNQQSSFSGNVKKLEPLGAAPALGTNGKPSSAPLGQVDLPTFSKTPSVDEPLKVEKTTVKRKGGGEKWQDDSLLEWDPNHFRLFVGNLSPEVGDEHLRAAFGKFASLSKVKVVSDQQQKSKGYGFVAFAKPDDYLAAFKQMNNKYIGNHPVHLKRAMTNVKPSTVKVKSKSNNRRNNKPYNRPVE